MATTKRQRAAVEFCEMWLQIEFDGDRNNFREVSSFLSQHLETAKNIAREVECEYEGYMWDLMYD